MDLPSIWLEPPNNRVNRSAGSEVRMIQPGAIARARLREALSVRNAMKVERIFTSQMPGGPQIEHESVRVVAGSGIEGDRYFGLHNEPGQNLTLIEIEEIEAFLFEQGRTDHISITHRNLLTRGVRLNELVGVEFTIGEVSLRGVELCEPCLGLGTALSSQTLSPAAAVKRFVRRGGLRADVLSSGVIERGATITLPPNPSVKGTGLRPAPYVER